MFPLADFNWRSSASPWRINLDWIGHNVSWKGHPVRPHNLLCMCFCFPYIVTQVSCNNHLRRGERNQGKLLTLCSSGKRKKNNLPIRSKTVVCSVNAFLSTWPTGNRKSEGSRSWRAPLWATLEARCTNTPGWGGGDGCWAPFDQAPASVPASLRHGGCGSGFGRGKKKSQRLAFHFIHSVLTWGVHTEGPSGAITGWYQGEKKEFFFC